MEILVVTDSPAKCKTLSTRIDNEGHVAIGRCGIDAGRKELERRLWTLDVVICCPDRGNVDETARLVEQVDNLRIQRGYSQRPHCVLITGQINHTAENRVRVAGGFVIPEQTDLRKLLHFIEIFNEQIAKEFYRPYILLEHGLHGAQNMFCDEQEELLGVSVGYLGPPTATDQTDKTAVLIDYLSQQRYPKTEREICEGILRSRFHWSQLKDGSLQETAVRMLICRARERLAPGLATIHSPLSADQVILNVPGHTRMYKINIPVKVAHRHSDEPVM